MVGEGTDKGWRVYVRVDPTKCKAYSVCANLVPSVFQIDEWGFGYAAHGDVTSENRRSIERAVRACPVKAIDIIEE